MVDLVGKQIGNYRLVSLLEQHGFSKIYLGLHISSNKQFNIEAFNFYLPEYETERFRQEMLEIIRLQHPNIVAVKDADLENGIPFWVMNYEPGNTFLQRHPKGSQLSLATIIAYVKQIALALQYMHNQNMIYKHVRPQNMLFDRNHGYILLRPPLDPMDWYDDDFIQTAETNSRYYYTAPEDLQDHATKASDQYSLGVTIYEWLCGELPFDDSSDIVNVMIQHIHSLPPSLREKDPNIPSAIEEVVMKALAKDPKQRFESVEVFADALEQAYLSSIRPRVLDRLGQQFGNYRLIRLLGRGGFADVYLGQHMRLNTYAAIKILHTHLSDEDIEGFQKEAQTIANLRHPHIVRILDFDVENNIPFLVMDYAPNGTLRQRYPKGSRLPLSTIVTFVKQVAQALQYAHDQKLIHRDVKPENMLLGTNNEVLLSDFGIAVAAHSSRSINVQDGAGTIYYMAPEQIQGKPRRASDQYALAVVVYEWLSGNRPFKGTYMEIVTQHLTAQPPPLNERNSTIPPVVEQVVKIALAKDPKQRFASIQAFANAFEQACQQ